MTPNMKTPQKRGNGGAVVGADKKEREGGGKRGRQSRRAWSPLISEMESAPNSQIVTVET